MKKHWTMLPTTVLLLIMAATALASSGGDYEVSFYTIDGGGSTSSGGVYEVTGAIGQHDAGEEAISGGDYALFGGFWSGRFQDFSIFIPLILR
jgi:hypothetical protein